jgi:plastocyanin
MRRYQRQALLAFAAVVCFLPAYSCINNIKPENRVAENTTVPVTAPPPWPHILDFEVSSENVSAGDNVTLKWGVSDAGVVTIDSGVGRVKQSGSVQVSPQKTTRYTLTATGEKGISTAWVTVQVPEIGRASCRERV